MNELAAILPVVILLLIGIVCRNKKIITENGIIGLQSLVMNITLPVGLFLTFFNASLTTETIFFPLLIFIVNAIGYPLGAWLCRVFRQKDPFLPFAMTTSEDGMIGYALLAMLMKKSEMTTFALMDLGQVLGFFVVTYQILNNKLTGRKVNLKGIIKNILTTPLLVGMLTGIICSVSGISNYIYSIGMSSLIESLCNYISAPTNAAILIVIGYSINLQKLQIKKLFTAVFMRLVQQGILCFFVLVLFFQLGGIFVEPITIISVIAIMSLPCTYLLPIYVEPKEEKEFYASFLSAYTLLSVVGYIVLKMVV